MRTLTALITAACLASTAPAFQGGQPAGQPPAQPPAGQPPRPQPPQPPSAQALPVPDGPVVKKTEAEGGLILEDIKIGEGYEIKPGDTLVVHYHGTLKDGAGKEPFDSSFTRGQPATFPLSKMVDGWQKGIPGMKIGGIRRLTVPSAMGYGAQGNGPSIPPNSDLVFVVQIVDALQIEDLKVGEGDPASGQSIAVATQVVKDKDGKEIEKADASKPYIWLPGEMVPPGAMFDTIQQGISGMKVGGKRRLTIPKEMNVPNPGLPSTRPANVPLIIELDLIGLRNLPQRGR